MERCALGRTPRSLLSSHSRHAPPNSTCHKGCARQPLVVCSAVTICLLMALLPPRLWRLNQHVGTTCDQDGITDVLKCERVALVRALLVCSPFFLLASAHVLCVLVNGLCLKTAMIYKHALSSRHGALILSLQGCRVCWCTAAPNSLNASAPSALK